MRTNLHHLLQQRADSHPEAPALTYKNTTLSYAELWRQVCGVAAKLAELGLEREQRVAVFLEKRIETVAAIFGTVRSRRNLRADQSACCGRSRLPTSLPTAGRAYWSPRRNGWSLLGDALNACPAIEHVLVVDARG